MIQWKVSDGFFRGSTYYTIPQVPSKNLSTLLDIDGTPKCRIGERGFL